MKIINIYPKNKKRLLRLIEFSKEILAILKKLKINPMVSGSLAYFIYTRDKNIKLHDIDFLIPPGNFERIMKILRKEKIIYKYIPEWTSLVVYKGDINIDLDAYGRKPTKLNLFTLSGLPVKVINLKDLIKIYKQASEKSKDKPQENLKKYLTLKNLK